MEKKYRKLMALLLSAIMITGSVSVVFAEGGTLQGSDAAAVEEMNDAAAETEDAVAAEDGTDEGTVIVEEGLAEEKSADPASDGVTEPEAATEEETTGSDGASDALTATVSSDGMDDEIGNVTDFVAHPSYKSIILTWKPVKGATSYVIERKIIKRNNYGKTLVKGKYKVLASGIKGKKMDDLRCYVDKNLKKYNYYYYRIKAVKKSEGVSTQASVKSAKYATIKKAQIVRNYYQTITFKAGASLTSHDGKNKTHYFKAGDTVISEGFGQGKYQFWYDGNLFYGSYIRFKNCKVDYVKNDNGVVKNNKASWARKVNKYDDITAENFVNACKKGSNTKYLIWVSTYQQHLYIFKGKKGNWKLIKDWEVSTGKAASPTPSGFNKKITEHVRRYSGIDYWCHFQSYNSIHAKRSYYVIGSPESHGCVRNFDENGKWIYEQCKNGTGLIIF